MRKSILAFMLVVLFIISACSISTESPASSKPADNQEFDYELIFPSDKYPETALHIIGAIEQGHSAVCTINRDGAEDNRKQSLAGIDTRKGYDRDEWPMAMCDEGGSGASVAYINASDNRGAGSWVGNQLTDYPDGTKVLFIVEKPRNLFPGSAVQPVESPQPSESTTSEPHEEEQVSYANCAAVRAAGKAPLHKGDPGYSSKLDRDGDGIACQ